ncbi:hypothetical protein TMA_048 [Thermus phage TMA]|uniref:hypothetical protein n=1 Tax=Thermus phage TMA TaxID=699370 RepID=UPI00021AAE41|nr:hypothetical protein TMA_048 [Thermus phage TMA]BAK53736.1 hypothetical protein TMA_048 [Thermus phage TMA]
MDRQNRLEKQATVRQAKMIVFLSNTCSFCQQLLSEYSDTLDTLGAVKLFVEEDRNVFNREYENVRGWLKNNNPDLAKYPYITPVLLVRDDNLNTVGVYLGYMSIKTFLDQLTNTQ